MISSIAITAGAITATAVTLASADIAPTQRADSPEHRSEAPLYEIPTTGGATASTEAAALGWVRVATRRHGPSARIARIPPTALAAYRHAEAVLAQAADTCNLSWTVLAAIARITSNHGRSGDSQLDDRNAAAPPIVGPRVRDENRTPEADTDIGTLDRDARFDRVVGPLHLTPVTWSHVGVDADQDGLRDPQDLDDAALATAVLLCSRDTDLSNPDDLAVAVTLVNSNQRFVRQVVRLAAGYRAEAGERAILPLPLIPTATDAGATPDATAAPTDEATVKAVKHWLGASATAAWTELGPPQTTTPEPTSTVGSSGLPSPCAEPTPSAESGSPASSGSSTPSPSQPEPASPTSCPSDQSSPPPASG